MREAFRSGVAHFTDIDDEHEEILGLARELERSLLDGLPRVRVAELMRRLIECTGRHFQTEEAAMRRCGYPSLADHVAAHDDLIQRLSEVAYEFERVGGKPQLRMVELVTHYLTVHLSTHDRQFFDYANAPVRVPPTPTLPWLLWA